MVRIVNFGLTTVILGWITNGQVGKSDVYIYILQCPNKSLFLIRPSLPLIRYRYKTVPGPVGSSYCIPASAVNGFLYISF